MGHFSQLDNDLTEAEQLLANSQRPSAHTSAYSNVNGLNDGQHLSQRLALAKLISEAESIVRLGLLPEQDEMRLRQLANDACIAFGFDSVCERTKPLAAVVHDMAVL